MLNVGELSVAESTDRGVVEQCCCESFVSCEPLLFRGNALAVAPALCLVLIDGLSLLGIPPDSAVLGYEYRTGNFSGMTNLDSSILRSVESVVVSAEGLGVLVVVVSIGNIREVPFVVPSRGIDNGTGGVKSTGEIYAVLDEPLVLILLSLVERAPAYDSGMVVVALDSLQPLGEEALPCGGSGNVKSPVTGLAPYEVTHMVCVIEESLLEYLLVESCAVVAHVDGALDVSLQLSIGGSGEDSVGVEALVEDKSLEYYSAVEVDLLVVDSDLTHTEVGLYAVVLEFEDEIIELRLEYVPEVELREVKRKKSMRLNDDSRCTSDLLAVVESGCGDGLAVCVYALSINVEALACEGGGALGVLYVRVGNVLEPYGLPDTRGSRVEATEGSVSLGLLTAGLTVLTEKVGSGDDDSVLALLESCGDIKLEGDEGTNVLAYGGAVYPYLGVVVSCADVENGASALSLPAFGKSNDLLVPYSLHKVGVSETRELTFGTEGNGDLHVEVILVHHASFSA